MTSISIKSHHGINFLLILVNSCDANEVYKSCWNPMCEKTCAIPKVRGKCDTSTCQGGCFCQSGYVRNEFGRCVRSRDCEVLDRNFFYIYLKNMWSITDRFDDVEVSIFLVMIVEFFFVRVMVRNLYGFAITCVLYFDGNKKGANL